MATQVLFPPLGRPGEGQGNSGYLLPHMAREVVEDVGEVGWVPGWAHNVVSTLEAAPKARISVSPVPQPPRRSLRFKRSW